MRYFNKDDWNGFFLKLILIILGIEICFNNHAQYKLHKGENS